MGGVRPTTFPRPALLPSWTTISPNPPVIGAVILGSLGVVQIVLHPGRSSGNLLRDLVLALCTTLPVAFARTRLLPAGAVVTVAVLLTPALGGQLTLAGLLAQTALLYLIGLHNSYRTAVLFAVPYVAYAVGPAESRSGGKLLGVGLLLGAAGVLTVGAVRHLRAQTAIRAAASGAYADMAYAYAAREERARIARELHDIVAHHISSISVQAETARLATPGLPAQAAARLRAIGETARLTLTEMRRLLGVLRDDAAGETMQTPQPGLAQLISLLDEARATAGSGTRLTVQGRTRRLDPGLELTAYRIVQETLTNARTHAPGALVDVEVNYADDALRLNIRDTGPVDAANRPRHAPASGGSGLLGIRERVAMAGGTLRTGRSRVGGFVVQAVLPISATAR
jgi:signal transduction histidine kinase